MGRLRNIFRRKKQKVEMSIQTEPWIEKLEEVQELQALVESSRRHVDELNKNSREERAIALDQMKGLEAKLKLVMEELAQMKIDYEHTAEVLFEITNERDDLEIVRQNEKEEFNEKLTKQIDELEMVCQGKLELESKLVNLRRDQDEMIVKLKFYEDKIEQRTKELSALAEENTKLNEGMAQQKQELERLGDDEEIKRWQEELEKVHERNKELSKRITKQEQELEELGKEKEDLGQIVAKLDAGEIKEESRKCLKAELDAVLEQNKELVVETTVQKDVLKELSRVKEELEKTVVKQKKELDENDVQKKTFEEMLEENKKLESENAEQKLQLQELVKERTQRKELEDTLVMQKKGLDEALTLKQEEFDAFVKQNKRVEQENEQQKKQFYDAMAQSMDELTTAVLQREELGETNLKQREEFDEIIAERTEELEALVMRNEDLVQKNAQQKQEIALLVKEKETLGQDVIKLRRKFEERIYQQKRELDRASRYRKDLEAGIKQREKDAYMLQKDLENDLGIEIKRVKELTDSIDEAKEGWERDKNQLAQAQSDLEHAKKMEKALRHEYDDLQGKFTTMQKEYGLMNMMKSGVNRFFGPRQATPGTDPSTSEETNRVTQCLSLRNDELTKQVGTFREEHSSLALQKEFLGREVRTMKEEMHRDKMKIRELRAQTKSVKVLTSELISQKQLRDQLEEEVDALKEERKYDKGKVEELTQIASEVSSQKDKMKLLHNLRSELQEEVGTMKEEMKQDKRKIKELMTAKKELMERTADVNHLREELRSQLQLKKKLEQEIGVMAEERVNDQMIIEEFKEVVKLKTLDATDLREEIAELSSQNKGIQTDHQNQIHRISELQEMLQDAEEKFENAQVNIKALEKTRKHLSETHMKECLARKEVQADLEKYQNESKSLQEKLEKDSQDFVEKTIQFEKEYQCVHAHKECFLEKLNEVDAENQRLKDANDQYEDELFEMLETNASMETRISELIGKGDTASEKSSNQQENLT